MNSPIFVRNPFSNPVSASPDLKVRFSWLAAQRFPTLFGGADQVLALEIAEALLPDGFNNAAEASCCFIVDDAPVTFRLKNGRRQTELCTLEFRTPDHLVVLTAQEAMCLDAD